MVCFFGGVMEALEKIFLNFLNQEYASDIFPSNNENSLGAEASGPS